MKMLLLATTYEYGGVSSVIRNLLANLERGKFNIVFIVERLSIGHYPLTGDIKLVDMNMISGKNVLAKLINIFKHLRCLRNTIDRERPDIVLSFGYPVNCSLLLSYLGIKNRPKIVLCDYTERPFLRYIEESIKENILMLSYRIAMFFLYRKADAIVCVSRSLASHIKRFFMIDDKKIKVIHVPVNIKEIQGLCQEKIEINHENINGVPCIGTVSRLSVEKGLAYLIAAFSEIVEKIDSKLVIIGDGKERQHLEKMVRDLGIEDKVNFLGWQKNPYAYIKKMDIFVLPSLWEGFPNVVIESMVCGTPVIATRSVGGMDEAITDGVDGILVPARDPNLLYENIYGLLKDSSLRNRLVNEASKKIWQFDSNKITKEYEAVIFELLGR